MSPPRPVSARTQERAHAAFAEAEASQGLLTLAQLRGAGLSASSVSRMAATGGLARVARQVYAQQALPPLPSRAVVDDAPVEDYLVRVRAALLSLGSGAFAYGTTAAAVRGWAMLAEPSGVQVAVRADRGRARVEGVAVRRVRSSGAGRAVSRGELSPLLSTSAVATVLHCLLALPRLEGLVLVDSALRSEQVLLEDLVLAVASLPGVAEVAAAREVLSRADPLCGSVLESVMRYHLVQAGITGFATQQVVRGERGRVLRVDFLFAGQRLVVEVDGRRFHEPARDLLLDNALAAAGYRVLRFGWDDVVLRPEAAIALVLEALAAA